MLEILLQAVFQCAKVCKTVITQCSKHTIGIYFTHYRHTVLRYKACLFLGYCTCQHDDYNRCIHLRNAEYESNATTSTGPVATIRFNIVLRDLGLMTFTGYCELRARTNRPLMSAVIIFQLCSLTRDVQTCRN